MLAAGALSDATLRAYRTDLRAWETWARAHGCPTLPALPDDVCRWLAEEAGTHSAATLQRRLSALNWGHELHGVPPPVGKRVRQVARALALRVCPPGRGEKAGLLLGELRLVCEALPDDPRGTRDRALLTLGWAKALRRSELAALTMADIDIPEPERGFIVTIRRSKTDQEARGWVKSVHHGQHAETCPVCALVAWLVVRGQGQGSLFDLSGYSVALVVQRRCRAVGLPGEWGGHSLRAGLVTSCAKSDIPPLVIAQTTRHKNLNNLLEYVRLHGDPFAERDAAMEAGM